MRDLPRKGEVLTVEEVVALCKEFGRRVLAAKILQNPPPRPFSSDGASAFPDEIDGVDIYPAAFWHDVKYWCGELGHDEERLIADCELAIGIVLVGGSAELADLVLRGVRAGGHECLPTPWRWGFGHEKGGAA